MILLQSIKREKKIEMNMGTNGCIIIFIRHASMVTVVWVGVKLLVYCKLYNWRLASKIKKLKAREY